MDVALFVSCLADQFYPRSAVAAVRVLEHLGCRVHFPAGQTCCGQPMFNNGFRRDARALAERMIRVFAPFERVVTPSGSCAAMIREHYAHLFDGDEQRAAHARALASRTREFCEFLVHDLRVDLRALGASWGLPDGRPRRVTWHFSCHLRGLGMTDEPARLLGQIAGVEPVPLERAEVCCGFGGTFATKQPEISGHMARDKAACLRATGAGVCVSGEPGCTMNLAGTCRRAGDGIEFLSPAEAIAASLGLMGDAPAERAAGAREGA